MTGEPNATPWTRRTVTIAVLVFAAAIVGLTPAAAVTAVSGVVLVAGLAAGRRGAAGRQLLGYAVAGIGAIGIAAGSPLLIAEGGYWALAAVTAPTTVVVGLSIDRVDLGEQSLQDVALSVGIAGGLLLVLTPVLLLAFSPSEGLQVLFDAILALSSREPQVGGFLVLVASALGALYVAMHALPEVTLLGRTADEDDLTALTALRQQTAIGALICLTAGVVAALLLFLQGDTPLGRAIGLVTANSFLRVVVVTVAFGALLASAVGVCLRWAWSSDDERLATWGMRIGAGLLVTAVVAASATAVSLLARISGTVESTLPAVGPGLLGVVGSLSVVVAGGLYAVHFLYQYRAERVVAPYTFAAAALATVVAAVLETDAMVLPLVAVAAVLVGWDAATYGRGLADELGDAAPSTEGELAHVGGSAGVAAVGVVVSVVGAFALEVIGPIVAASGATLTVAIGALAVVFGAMLVAADTN